MHPLKRPGRRAWRALVSALAGSGLTAASLSGHLSSTALGAGVPGTTSTGEGTTPPPVSTTTVTGSQEASTSQPSTTPTTTVAPPPLPSSKRQTTTGTKPSTPPPAPEAPKVVLKQKQKSTGPSKANARITPTTGKLKTGASKSGPKSGPSNVALSPQVIASQAGALAAALASSAASVQALGFYRIPPFLLPIYKAAAAQYGVPWQILAAINEIETNYGSDQSVSTAGAVGWMQFMPATWLQYGVDALNAGYADPYNPVDAIFAAARYLRAAGAQTDLHAAILAYNHSEEYASSVLLRAKLISTYPRSVVAALTGLIDGRLPVTGKQVGWGALLPTRSTATANATAAGVPSGSSKGEAATPVAESAKAARAPGASAAPSPATAAAHGRGKVSPKVEAPLQLVDLMSAPNANVVAVQDGRIVQIGETRELGKYVVLRDVYGDLFTYAGLGSIAPTYTLPHAAPSAPQTPAATIASTHDHAPSQPATAGRQPPLTLRVKVPTAAHRATAPDHAVVPADPAEATPAGMGKVRLFAHPGNPDAVAAAASAARRASSNAGHRPPRLRRGAIVATGTVLGRVRTPSGAVDGHLRFAIRPAGDGATVDPRPILASWAQLASALHPQGAKAAQPLLGATASDVFLLSKEQLATDVLSDPGITIDACGRGDIASGAVDRRVLAMLAFLSRSGLQPTVGGLRCAAGATKPDRILALDISAVNGTPISGHQGPGTVTDLTIRTLLSLPSEYQPERIVSLMRYPGAANTHATPQSWNRVQVQYHPASQAVALNPATAGAVARSAAAAARAAVAPLVVGGQLTPAQWDQLITRIAALPAPTVAVKPSSSAIRDPKQP
jgi:Transglycosylase SLT domain